MNVDEKINILLVDDREENLLALEAIIDREEYNLIKAYSGEEALKHLLKYDFAAILLDVQMPGMDGFGTAKIIKAREKTKNIPILFITANNLDSDHIFTGYSIGAIDYLLKPFDPIILKAKVDGFVEIYKLNQKLKQQTAILAENKRELEHANQELSALTSELRVSEALANVISETSIDSMIIIDNSGSILKVNPAVKDMFQYNELEIIGHSIYELFSCENSRNYITHVLEAINNLDNIVGYENFKEICATRKDKETFSVEIQIGKRFVQGNCIVACTIRDITKKKQYEETITYMAHHDSLTELPNRRLFNDQLNTILKNAKQANQPFALMYLDLDRFKYINDSLGHLVGDKLLQEVAKRLRMSIRPDDFVARLGGDEFNIILPTTNRENALELAEKITEVFKEPFYIDNYELFTTTCIGISVFPYDGEETLVLMKNADAALYRAKEQGRNQYKVYHSGMNIQSFKTFMMQSDLRKAIERNEFTVVYQPRIELETGEIKAVEALLHWHHPNWGTIMPAEIIPLAEETGLFGQIGLWFLKSVCSDINDWEKTGITPLQVAINFSPRHFLLKDVTNTIKRILSEMNVSPKMVEFGISESLIMGNETTITQIMTEMKNMGISISLEHFGMGYTSLNTVSQLPIDKLKIDQSYVQGIGNSSSKNKGLMAAVVALAHNLKFDLIAEGVESEQQRNSLRDLGCKEVQGSFYCLPVSAKELETLMLDNKGEESSNKNSKVLYFDSLTNIANDVTRVDHNSELELANNEEILYAALQHIKKLYGISNREMDVFILIVDGLSNKKISEKLFISEHTVKNHITHILQKLNVNDRMQAMAIVYQACIEKGQSKPAYK